MKTQPLYFEILAVLLLSVIPWPGPSVFKISCHRDRASVVRRIVQKKWIPILRKYQVDLPLECPFHKSRDVFYPQQSAKHQHRPSQWTCGLCGKSFYAEKHLDVHFDNRHKSNVNTAEDAVCLADYCDIMRCDVLGTRDFESSLAEDSGPLLNTDIQVWKESSSHRTSVGAHSESRDLAKSYRDKLYMSADDGSSYERLQQYCQRGSALDGHRSHEAYGRGLTGPDNKSSDACDSDNDNDNDSDSDNDDDDDDDDDDPNGDYGDYGDYGGASDEDEKEREGSLVEAALPPGSDRKARDKAFELRKLKSNCKQDDLQKLKVQCEVLVRDCIAGLLANLSLRDFQDIEGELNRAICWYLSCDRYWEDTKRQRHTPWYLLITFLLMLLFGMFVCYYVIWVLFNSTEEAGADGISRGFDGLDYNIGNNHAGSSSRDSNSYGERKDDSRGKSEIDEPPASADAPDRYVYVAYPPELKRRLLESCYNRTTRL